MSNTIDSRKAVVILGAGIMQIPAIRSVQKKGIISIVFDGNKLAPGREIAHHFETIDLKDCSSILAKCIEYREVYHIAGVFTAGTDFSYAAAWISERLGLTSITYETALKATDKSKMRKAFKDNNVPSPGFIIAEKNDIDDAQINELGFPLVVKPVDSMGARGTVRVDSRKELEKAFSAAIKYSRLGKVIIEQFIEGAEFSLDAVIKNGNISVCGIADRHIFFPPYFVEMGHTMPSSYPQEVTEKVVNVFCDGIKAIGIDNGSAKGDIKYSSSGAVVGEIAARLSGGYMSGWTFPYSTGFSVIDAAIDIAMGNDPGSIIYNYDKTSAERAFISIPGKVDSIIIPDYILNRNEKSTVRDLFLNIRSGDSVNFPRNNVEKCGNVIAVHKDRESAVFEAEKACRDIVVKLKPSDPDTFNFLLGEKEEWIPDAFRLRPGILDNISDYCALPDTESADIIKFAVFIPEKLSYDYNYSGKDWQGRSIDTALKQIKDITGVEYITEVSDNCIIIPGKIFLKSVSRGSVQGGVWIIETLRDFLLKGNDIKDFRC